MSFQVLCSLKSRVVPRSVELSELYILDTKLYQVYMVCKFFFPLQWVVFLFSWNCPWKHRVFNICNISFSCFPLLLVLWVLWNVRVWLKSSGQSEQFGHGSVSLLVFSDETLSSHFPSSSDMLSFSPVAEMRSWQSPTCGPLRHSFCFLGLVSSLFSCVMPCCSWKLAVFGNAC